MERSAEEVCDSTQEGPPEVPTIEGVPKGYDPGIPLDVVKILTEGKGVGDASTDITRDVVLAYATTKGASFQKGKAKARSAARKFLEKLLKRTYNELSALTSNYTNRKVAEKKAIAANYEVEPKDAKPVRRAQFNKYSKKFKSILKGAYHEAYELGLKSTGAAAFLTAGGGRLVSAKDRRWVEGAFKHEMRYLNKLLDDIKNVRNQGRVSHRIGMYVATVGSIYYTGRVAVTPPNHVLFWVAKIDKRICPQCRYMAVNSPYTKFNIPITPASGHTRCLSNCRCSIAVRPVSQEYFGRVATGVGRATHLRRLRAAIT